MGRFPLGAAVILLGVFAYSPCWPQVDGGNTGGTTVAPDMVAPNLVAPRPAYDAPVALPPSFPAKKADAVPVYSSSSGWHHHSHRHHRHPRHHSSGDHHE